MAALSSNITSVILQTHTAAVSGRRRSPLVTSPPGRRIPTVEETFSLPSPLARTRPLLSPTPPLPPRRSSFPPINAVARQTSVCAIHAAHLRSRSCTTLPHFLPRSLAIAASRQPDFLSSSNGRRCCEG